MKKMILNLALVAMGILMMPQQTDAQSILNSIKNAASSVASDNSTVSAVTNVVSNLLGTSSVSESSLVGTWTYNEPSVAFESSNLLTSVGGSVASNKIEDKFASAMEAAGFKSGAVVMTLNSDKTGTVAVSGKSVPINWSVSDSDFTMNFKTGQHVTSNAKLSGNTLQLAMSADKVKTIVGAAASAASSFNASIATVNTLLENVDGVYLGMKFTK